MEPKVYMPEVGYHNRDLDVTNDRLEKSKSYQDLSTIIICPTRGQIPARVVQSWMGMMRPMNQKVIGPLFAIGMEVGQAYCSMIEMVLNNPELSKWKYILTIEEDNAPPADGLLKLYESMDKFDVVSGLYWTKGEGGMAMQYGDPKVFPKNFIPQKPIPNTVTECNGLGMGFGLFKLDIFKNKNLPKPWFRTVQEVVGGGARAYTQDLFFFEQAAKLGYRYAVDSRVLVSHYDFQNDVMW
jgi:hypothetical protein